MSLNRYVISHGHGLLRTLGIYILLLTIAICVVATYS